MLILFIKQSVYSKKEAVVVAIIVLGILNRLLQQRTSFCNFFLYFLEPDKLFLLRKKPVVKPTLSKYAIALLNGGNWSARNDNKEERGNLYKNLWVNKKLIFLIFTKTKTAMACCIFYQRKQE